MTASQLKEMTGSFVFVTLDGSAALARVGYDAEMEVFFLEWPPVEHCVMDPYRMRYLRFRDLTNSEIEEFKPHGRALIFTGLTMWTEEEVAKMGR